MSGDDGARAREEAPGRRGESSPSYLAPNPPPVQDGCSPCPSLVPRLSSPAMERPARTSADGGARPCPWNHRAWLLVLLAVAAWQSWMTLTLFGPDHPLQRLLDDEPIVSGRHPLHLYHGYLGSLALSARGTPCCYDPNFQAGYPKTPVFDSGSRPAEWFLLLAGVQYRPAAYKIGLACCCVVVPFLLFLAARGAGLNRAPSCLATLLGLMVWWGVPARAALEGGDLDLLVGAAAAAAQAGMLLQFHRSPGARAWLALVVVSLLGWFTFPALFALLLPLGLIYYLSIGARHRILWHLSLLAGVAVAVAANLFWLVDWLNYWWIRAPLRIETDLLSHRTLRAVWEAPTWGGGADRALAIALLAVGTVGVVVWNFQRERASARLLGLGAAGLLVLSVVGMASEPLGSVGAVRLVIPALLFAVAPAVYALVWLLRSVAARSGAAWRAALVASAAGLACVVFAREPLAELARRCNGTMPLAIGLSPEREAVVAALTSHTTREARILWEDRPGQSATGRWTALLPVLTDRAFVGGLDANAGIVHEKELRFADQMLADRWLRDWSDAELEDFFRRYNVGWAVCWSPAAIERLRAWRGVEAIATLSDGGTGCLFAIHRAKSYVLRGDARWLHADSRRIALGDVTPDEKGEVWLSLHYQTGLRAAPGQVQVEQVPNPNDIPFVRLRLPGPVTRVVLTWENR